MVHRDNTEGRHVSHPCLDGDVIQHEDFRFGILLTASLYTSVFMLLTGIVLEANDFTVCYLTVDNHDDEALFCSR